MKSDLKSDAKETRAQDLETLLVLSTACIVAHYFLHQGFWLVLALLFGLIGIFSSWLSGRISWLWLKLAHSIGYVTSRILLGLIFYLVLAPLGWLARSGNKLGIRLSRRTDSYWIECSKTYGREDLENIW